MQKTNKIIMMLFLPMFAMLACGQLSFGIEAPVFETPSKQFDSPPVKSGSPGQNGDAGEVADAPVEDPLAWLNTDRELGTTLPAFLAGLEYRDTTNNYFYLVNKNGESVFVTLEGYSSRISPDGSKLLDVLDSAFAEDIQLIDLNSGEIRQLTSTPDILERNFQIWEQSPELVVFNFIPRERLGPWSGFLGAVNLNSDEYLILDDKTGSNSGFSLSPDGQSILYDGGDNILIHTIGQGSETIDMAAYGINFDSYAAPAWSPDGNSFAVSARGKHSADTGGDDSGGITNATVIVDLENQTAKILHEHQSVGQRTAPEIAWSPDGDWLAVVNQGEVTASSSGIALWVMRTDGSEEYNLGLGSTAFWSPDGSRLIYTRWPAFGTGGGSFQEDAHITVVETGIWEAVEIVELLGSDIRGWINLP